MAFCLTIDTKNKFKKALRDKEIDPVKLSSMTSLERRTFLEKYVGKDNSQQVNALFESKLLLKNQKAGYITWAKNVSGITQKTRMDLISKIERLDKVLDPQEETQFLNDLASTKLGVNVTQEEAKTISELSKNIQDTKVDYNIDEVSKLTPKQGIELMKDKVKNRARLKYGEAVVTLDNYITDLKLKASKITLEEFKKNPFGVTARGVKTAFDLTKSMNASYDDSAILNQGFPILANVRTAPIWARNAVGTLVDIVKTFGGKPVWDSARADILSRPNFINGLYKSQKLAVNVLEEQFPTNIPEGLANWGDKGTLTKILTIPTRLFGKGYKATEVAFNVFQMRNRADVFDLFTAIADNNKLDVTTKSTDIEGLGKFVNSLTSRGNMGPFEPVANLINSPFFSLRKQVANVESLFGYQFGKKSPFVRKLGAGATLQQLALISIILGISYALKKDSVEMDPTSSDFGKVRVGSTRFDLTQGRAGYITLLSRILLNRSKSSTTGETKQLNTGDFGSATSMDLLTDFAQNKLSPIANQFIYIINREDRSGEKSTVKSVLSGLFVPLNFKSIPETLNNPDSANFIATTLANFFGVQTNVYLNSNVKSQLVPTGTEITNDSFINGLIVFSKALGVDPVTAFSRVFTGQKIMKVSDGGIVVVSRDTNTTQFKKDWVELHGGKTSDIKELRADHIIPIALGGSDLAKDNLAAVPTSVWSSNTKVETTLISAVKKGKISKKEAQELIKKYKRISKDKYGSFTEDPDKELGEEIIAKYK